MIFELILDIIRLRILYNTVKLLIIYEAIKYIKK